MYQRLKERISTQLIVLASCIALAALFNAATGFRPTLRLSGQMLMRGVFGGMLALIIVVALTALGIAILGQQRVRLERFPWKPVSPLTLAGAALTAAGGEELLLRGFLFGYLSTYSVMIAFTVNAALAFALSWQSPQRLFFPAVRAVEASLFATMYSSHHSLLVLVAGRLISEAGLAACLQTEKFFKYADDFASAQRARRVIRQQAKHEKPEEHI